MLDMLYLMMIVQNLTPNETVQVIDWYIETNTQYKFYYHAQKQSVFLNTSIGDCTDKAILKCNTLNKLKIPCRLVHGYAYNIRKSEYKHDFYQYKINNKWYSSEPNITTQLKGVW